MDVKERTALAEVMFAASPAGVIGAAHGPAGESLAAPARVGVLPEHGYLRLWQIIGDRKAKPPVPGIIPIGKSSWWAGVASGRFPQPVKLGPRTTAWRVEQIRALIESTK